MFEEGQYFAPVVDAGDGSLTVQLGEGHPGMDDPVYRRRRDVIATTADRWTPGEPAPVVDYTDDEHEVWRVVCDDLRDKHETYACREFLDGKEALGLPTDRVPQLEELSDGIEPLTGFRYRPAAGLVPLREFYGALADHSFWATQYVRHHSVPLYTPEPDVLHEVVGHGNTLADPRFTELYEAAGAASRRVESAEALEFVSRVFWFTLEFGVVHEADGLKAFGAGILSSPGEIEEFRSMTILPLDVAAMGTQDYDITHYQEVLFAARSFAEVQDVVGGFWDSCDDDSIARLR
ncbi:MULTISPECIES: phenylalanine 4-monooxygenase [Aeromicrobium]|uniref:phenylalanine 4-monooxygenase n=1 Tax=Aeromicrobium TaxID=2040 RepID=UPI0007021CCB|nr:MULTISPECIES: phenylalanine 4-monooxygenase [Aeromicrobium]KQX75787.1 phenylalanine 4-monooxygenase [Aeromicrobium sp. Root472D3]MCL8250676.1 phenylalanine 4-monooxygenase [Aeromicrobium fastidiosum]